MYNLGAVPNAVEEATSEPSQGRAAEESAAGL